MVSTNSASLRMAAWVMALCPVSLAIVFHVGIRPEPLAIASPQLPALSFHQFAVDLRKIHPTTETQATFVFQNRGKQPVQITKMDPSCGCLTPRLQGDSHDGVIAPGDHGRIILRMQPANSTPGGHEYTVNVSYTDPEPREVQLTLKLVIPETYMSVTPPALIVYHPAGSQPTITDFTITEGNGKPFDITDVSVNTDLVEAVIGESSRTRDGKFQMTVRTSIAGDLPPGKSQVLLRIATTDLENPELRVPILLQGPTSQAKAEKEPALDHEIQ